MRLLTSALFFTTLIANAATFTVIGNPASESSWPAVLSSVGHLRGPASTATVFVARPGTPAAADWQQRVNAGATLILEGSSPLAASFGFRPRVETVETVHLVDRHSPKLPVIWEHKTEIPYYDMPKDAQVFAKERWKNAPVTAGMKLGSGAVLWVALDPGKTGYERFPYLLQSLGDLGVTAPFRSARLWTFFDYSYRTRVDLDYLATKWRTAGISAIHVAAWHFYDGDRDDNYLQRLIAACHRHGVLVYAWVELPHVSEKFWADHPAWREKTAALQDAQLDWRKLMNMQNPECVAAVRAGLETMTKNFDWDGINLAELYFESLEGAGNPARFTPMNDDVRRTFQATAGWDPIEIWGKHNDAASLRRFLDWRADLTRQMQQDWLGVAEGFRKFRPDLDIVLTHVDDRFDTGMRDSIGADAGRVLPLLDTHDFSFLIEDPATVWNLGPQRYPEIAKRYQPLTKRQDKLAIDINIVDRYQDVYPTKQQTGTELFQLVHLASTAFRRVALYFENSILKPDMALLPAASAVVTSHTRDKQKTRIDSPYGVELDWAGEANVDGQPWPALSKSFVRLPPGAHTVERGSRRDLIHLIDLNAELKSAAYEAKRLTFEYSSDSRAIARFDRKPARVEVDSALLAVVCAEATDCSTMLPRGIHRVLVD